MDQEICGGDDECGEGSTINLDGEKKRLIEVCFGVPTKDSHEQEKAEKTQKLSFFFGHITLICIICCFM